MDLDGKQRTSLSADGPPSVCLGAPDVSPAQTSESDKFSGKVTHCSALLHGEWAQEHVALLHSICRGSAPLQF